MARYDLADELLKKLDAELRREINRLDVIGFDELLARVDNLLKLLEGRPDVLTGESEDPDETLPF